MRIAISSGHGKYIRGAAGPEPWGLDEVDEARKVVRQVASWLFDAGHEVVEIHDDISTTQSANLDWLVKQHNKAFGDGGDLAISVHFNCYDQKAHGVEVLYVTQEDLSRKVSAAIAAAGELTDRGPKYRSDLAILNGTVAPCILIETAFCDHKGDCEAYADNFGAICEAIVETVGDQEIEPVPPEPGPDLPVTFEGTCSWFGGPDDDGVSPSEGLAFLYEVSDAPDLFLPQQPPGTTGLARRLDPETFYVATRWDYSITPKDMLRDQSLKALVRANDQEFLARPADWGPNENTGRVADLSPGLMDALGIDTDSQVEVIYPAPIHTPGPEPEVAEVNIQITSAGPVRITVNGTDIGEL